MSSYQLVRAAWLPLCASFLAGATLSAQEPAPPSDSTARALPVVQVVGSVLSTTAPEVGSGVPARSAVIAADDIRARQPRHLAEVLASLTAVSLYDDLGSPWKPTLVLRGFTASPVVGLPQGVSVFVDGVPVNEPDAGQVNFELLPLAHVHSVEVLSGTASLLGPNSLGGAVNLITRRGGGAPHGEITAGAGTHATRWLDASAGGESGGWSYYAGAGHEAENGWRQQTAGRVSQGLLSLGRFGARSGAGLQVYGGRSRVQTAGSLPLSVYDVRPDSNLSAGDFEALSQLHLAVTGYAPVSGGRGAAVVYFRGHDAERFNVNQVDDPDVRGFSRTRTLGASLDWRGVFDPGRGALGIRLGAGGTGNGTEVRLFAERLEPGLTTHVSSPISKLDAYVLTDYRVRWVTVSGGVRADAVHVPFRNRLRPARDTTSTFTNVSPSLGVRVVARSLVAYASAGRSFRAPAIIELACADPEEPCPLPFALGDDPPLAPVTATTLEVGTAWSAGAMHVNASAYRTEVRDDIFLFPYRDDAEPEGSTIDGFFANVPHTRREGVEMAARLALRGGHVVRGSHALSRATFRSSAELFSMRAEEGAVNVVSVGDRMPLVPAHATALDGDVRLPRGLRAGASAHYTGRRWLRGDEANETPQLPAHWVTHARLSLPLERWTVRLLVQNVLDRRFATFGTFNVNQGGGDVLERFLTPAQPRAFRVVLHRRFGAGE